MPVLQLYQPANPYLLSAMHDYQQLTHEDDFLRSERV